MDLNQIKEAIISYNEANAKQLTQQALDEGMNPKTILDDGLIAGMSVVGDKFKKGEVFLPEVLVASKALYAGLDLIKPLLAESGESSQVKIAMGTVKGDLHDIGKNLVCIMLEGAGYEVMDLGVDVTSDKFVEAAKNADVKVIGMSALLTTTMIEMKGTIEKLKAEGIDVKTIIGGAPITQEYADEIGADGFAPDAASAVDTVKKLIA